MKKLFYPLIIVVSIVIGAGVTVLLSKMASVSNGWIYFVAAIIVICLGIIAWLILSSVQWDHPVDKMAYKYFNNDRTKERLFRIFTVTLSLSAGLFIGLYPLDIGTANHIFLSFVVSLVLGGMGWIVHSDKRLRQVWQLEKATRELDPSKNQQKIDELQYHARIFRELRDVDRNWATVCFAGAALIIALLALLNGQLS